MIEKLFRKVIRLRAPILVAGILAIGATASFLPQMTRDTSADAFIPADNPARVYREQVKETFGLADPIIIALFQDGERGIFTPEALKVVETLTNQVQDLANIDPDRVVSLATEKNIEGTNDGMEVELFFKNTPESTAAATAMRERIENFPLYQGSLVARDNSATLIVAEVFDEHSAEETYTQVQALVNKVTLPKGMSIHIAGEAAVSGYLGKYIDADAKRLNPIAGLIITIILFLAFRTIAGAMLPNLIVAATVVGTVGLMSAFGVSFFVITNAMPVVLIGIAVADSIHIFSAYYESIQRHPHIKGEDAVVEAMLEMARPITLTTLTTIAGFLGLYISSVQPPMQFLGLFTALGVAIAWAYSMTVLPAAMSYLKVKPSKVFNNSAESDLAVKVVTGLGDQVIRHPGKFVTAGLLLVTLGIAGAMNIEVNEKRIETFHVDEPIYIADQEINAHFDGTSVFDIVVETDNPEALFNPAYLRKIEAFQTFIEAQDNVGGTTSVVDYLKQMNRSINEGAAAEYRLIDDEQLNAQLFLLYSTSGDPTDFEEEIDYDYQRANIRVGLTSSSYQELKPLVAVFNEYIKNEFNEAGLKATLSGRAMITYEWVDAVGSSHFKSVLVSLALVFLMAAVVFKSATAGLISLTPVAISILVVYAVMSWFDIAIGIGTSMFASVAIGLGVDFAIHTIDRIKLLYKDGDSSDSVMLSLFPTTGRALIFNLFAIAFGFGVLTTSDVVPLMRFGGIVALSVSTAFLFSLTFLPALILLIKPRFIYGTQSTMPMQGVSASILAGVACLILLNIPATAIAQQVEPSNMSAREIMQQVLDRDDGLQVSRTLTMELTDRRGKTRQRVTRSFRKYFGEDKRTVLFYLSPTNIKDTGFLTHDYADIEIDDDQWLYLPAARKIRRISASDRGDYFLGTDFSYEDIKNENKPNLSDYVHKIIGSELIDGVETTVIEGTPVTEQVSRELGYGRVLSYVDPNIWVVRKSQFWDIKMNQLKVVHNKDIRLVDNIWTSFEIHAENFKTGHKTKFKFSAIDYQTTIEDKWFESRQLRRGL
jgi:predicted RND superfamily exporter protein